MVGKSARAEVAQIRQTTQFSCCAASIASAMQALGKSLTEDDVNKVLGAAPMAGATWEAMLATVQYFGCRGSLVVPSTPRMLKAWTDKGIPVVIAWNPEGRPWSHASTVFDVVEGSDGKLTIYVMDPNIPNPSQTTRVLGEDEFCQKWGEKVSDTLIVRRPAMAVEREVTVDGRQVVASRRKSAASHDMQVGDFRVGDKVRGTGNLSGNVTGFGHKPDLRDPSGFSRDHVQPYTTGEVVAVDEHGAFKGWPRVVWDHYEDSGAKPVHPANLLHRDPKRTHEVFEGRRKGASTLRVADAYLLAKRPQDIGPAPRDPNTVTIKKEDLPKTRLGPEFVTTRRPGGPMHTRTDDVDRGRSRKEKHKRDWADRESADTSEDT